MITTALTEKHVPFSGLLFFLFLLCPVFFCLFLERNETKTKQNQNKNKNKQDHKVQTRKPLSLLTKKKADNTDIKRYNFIV